MKLLRWMVATRRRKIVAAVAAALLIPFGALGWYLGSPLFIDKVVDEPFPLSARAELPPDMTQEEAEGIMAVEATRNVFVDEPMIEPETPDEALDDSPEPTSTPEVGSDDVPTPTVAQDPSPTATATVSRAPAPTATLTPTSTAMPAAAEPQATALKAGEFRDADRFHQGSGSATVYELPDGTIVVRLEDFMVTNGPELHVLLSVHQDPDSRSQVMNMGYVDLGDLKGNIGNQNYEVAADIDVSAYSSVVIYCKPFHVVFSVASLDG